MKATFFILLTLTTYLSSLQAFTITMPPQIQEKLCRQLSDKPCNKEQQLHYSHYFKLDNDAILLFFHLYQESSFYPHGSLNTPTIINDKGQWNALNSFVNDNIQEIVRDPNNGIWLHTVSLRKDGYSSLYYSSEGVKWKKIKLPSIRTFQELKLCFQKNNIILTFQRVENDNIKAWITNYNDALQEEPNWRLMEKKELYQKVCQKTSAYNNAWFFKKTSSSNILFQHKYNKSSISFPKIAIPKKIIKNLPLTHVSKFYTIQLGTFNFKTSLPLIYKEFESLKKSLITKEIQKNDKIQYKVFLGSFNDAQSARLKLQLLKEEYINSKLLSTAFITKLP